MSNKKKKRQEEQEPQFGRVGCPFCECDVDPPPIPGQLVYGFCALSGAAYLAVYGYEATLKAACDGHRILLKDGFAIKDAQRKNPNLPVERLREVADQQPDVEIRRLRPVSRKHSGTSDKQLENEIIDRFMKFVMSDLRESGFSPIGLAGSVVFSADDADAASRANNFWILDEGITVNGKPLTSEKFVRDVGELLLQEDS